MKPSRTLTTAALVVFAAAGGLGACFSERGTTGPDGFACDVPIPEQVAGTTIVFIRDYEFIPAQVRVEPGTRVSWVNCGPLDTHTATSDDGVWDSGSLAPAGTYTRTFGTAGTFDYHCTPHPFMTGSIVVE